MTAWPVKRAAKIGRHADIVGDAVAKAIAAGHAPGQIVLAPGEEIARERTAIAQILLVQEHAVVKRVEDRLDAGLDVAPGLLDPPPRDEIRREVLRRVEEGRVAEAGIGDVGRHRRPADRCRARRRAVDRRRRQGRAGSRARDLVGIGEEGAERPGEVGVRVLGRDRDRHAVGQWIGVADLRRARDKGCARLAAEIEEFRFGVVVREGALRLADQQSAEGRIALAQTRDVAVNAALVVVEDRVGVRGGEVELDIGLDLAIGARRARIEKDAALLAREIPFGAAAMGKADRRARAGREGMGVQRDAGQIAGAALAVDKGLVERALAVERAADGAALQVPTPGPTP